VFILYQRNLHQQVLQNFLRRWRALRHMLYTQHYRWR